MGKEFLGVASINGELSSLEKANISISDRGFLFGHAVFETLLVNHGKLTHWEQHFNRLLISCSAAFILPPEQNTLLSQINNAIHKNITLSGFTSEKAQVRVIITGGNSFELGIKKTTHQLPSSNIVIICRNVSGPSVN